MQKSSAAKMLRPQKSSAFLEAELSCTPIAINASMAEEQPQQNDHRDRHAEQPKQYPSSHLVLLQSPRWRENATARWQFLPLPDGTIYQWPVLGIEAHGSCG